MLEQANDLICIPLAYSAYFCKQSIQKKRKKIPIQKILMILQRLAMIYRVYNFPTLNKGWIKY